MPEATATNSTANTAVATGSNAETSALIQAAAKEAYERGKREAIAAAEAAEKAAKENAPFYKQMWFWIVALIVVALIVWYFFFKG